MNADQLWRMLQGESIDGKYHLKKFLGAGGYGGVFLADEVVDDDFQREVAVKLISPENDPKKREEQRKELKNAVNLKHPNLLDCFVPGLCQIKGSEFFYLVMELAEETLEQHLQKGTLSATEVMEIVKAIASALAYLHNGSPPKVHRDVKPGNLLRVGNRWKLADLGLLTAIGSQSSAFTSNRRATIKYAPPEAYQGTVATAWDIWSLGVMIVEMLTGELPFRGETEVLLMNQVINNPPSIEWSKVPAQLVEIIEGCLEKDREKRWTVQKVIDRLSLFRPFTSETVPVNHQEETYSRLLKDRIIFLATQIDNDVANQVVAQFLFLESESSERDIYLYINSPGGSVTSGMAIYDTIQNIKPDVVTVCIGLAASMAAILLSAGTKGKRYSLPFSRIMINQPCWGTNVVDVDIDLVRKKELMFWRSKLSKILALHTSQPIEKVYEDTEQDYFMSAMEAKEYRIIDRVVSKKPKTINNGD